MAWRNSGVLIRQLLGKRSNPCPCAGLIHHQHRNLSSSNSITQTQTLPSSPSSPPHTIDSLHSPNHLHSLQHQRRLSSASAISFSSPATMLNITTRTEYERAIKQVKDGLLPAVFCFIDPFWPASLILLSPKIRKLREKFPHVKIYKILVLQPSIDKICTKMKIDDCEWDPTFHFYQNGKKADEVCGADANELMDTFRKLYRYVIPVETTQPTSSSGMGRRRSQQQQLLVVQVKKDEGGNGVKGGRKVANVGTFSQHRGGAVSSQRRGVATLSQQSGRLALGVESSTALSFDLAMQAVGFELGEPFGCELWWFAFGLFKSQPEKSVMFCKIRGYRAKKVWLLDQMAEE